MKESNRKKKTKKVKRVEKKTSKNKIGNIPVDFCDLPVDKDGVPRKKELIAWFRMHLGMEE